MNFILNKDSHRYNHGISSPSVRLIGIDGEQVGVVLLADALLLAKNHGLDLVEIAANANPPVCKIINYSKFLYQEEQKSKAHKSAKQDIKEIRLRPRIEEHDIKTKTNQIIKFLSQGHKVKVSLQFKGREVSRPELGKKVIQDLITALTPYADLQAPPSNDGRGIYLTLFPKKN